MYGRFLLQRENFINGITTSEINRETDDINKVISGIPTPFARTRIFKHALENFNNNNPRGLDTFSTILCDEWKGLQPFYYLKAIISDMKK